MNSRSMTETLTVPTLPATMAPLTAGALGKFFRPLAGPAGVLF